jgi:protein-tyrosine phosphatase
MPHSPRMEILVVNAEGTLLVSGEIDDWEQVRARRVDSIVDLDGGVDPGLPEVPNELLYVYYPLIDDELPNLAKLETVARLVADLVTDGHVVLVHCRLGLNRSNLVVATALTYLGLSGAQALDHLRLLHPGILYNENFAQHVSRLPARARVHRGA